MSTNLVIVNEAVLIPLAVLIAYYDVRYRRIPNAFVLGALVSGLVVNTIANGLDGLVSSVAGGALGFGLLLIMRFCGALGAGDVKLFGAIGALIGVHLVPTTLLLIVLIGGLLAIFSMLHHGTVRQTMLGVGRIFTNPFRGQGKATVQLSTQQPQTVPYGVAITLGSVISVGSALVNV